MGECWRSEGQEGKEEGRKMSVKPHIISLVVSAILFVGQRAFPF